MAKLVQDPTCARRDILTRDIADLDQTMKRAKKVLEDLEARIASEENPGMKGILEKDKEEIGEALEKMGRDLEVAKAALSETSLMILRHETSCRRLGCTSEHSSTRKCGSSRKQQRRKRIFCRRDQGIRTLLSKKAYRELQGNSELRVVVVK